MKELTLGIDPGLTGGVGAISGEVLKVYPVPIIKGAKGSKTQHNTAEMEGFF